jgi:hypothetical protein
MECNVSKPLVVWSVEKQAWIPAPSPEIHKEPQPFDKVVELNDSGSVFDSSILDDWIETDDDYVYMLGNCQFDSDAAAAAEDLKEDYNDDEYLDSLLPAWKRLDKYAERLHQENMEANAWFDTILQL